MADNRQKFNCQLCNRLVLLSHVVKIPEHMLSDEQKKKHSVFGLDVCPACGVRVVVAYLMKGIEKDE